MNRRRLLINQRQDELPQGYTRCDYLESVTRGSTGQAIDTGELARGTLGIEICYQPLVLYSDVNFIFGGENSWVSGTSYNLQVGDGSINNGFVYCDLRNADGLSGYMRRTNTKYIYTALNQNSKLEIIDTEAVFQGHYKLRDFTSNSTVTLFGINRNKSIVRYDISRIYYCKLFEGTELIKHLIPCLDNNNRPCMYDLINKQTHYNIGTGEFDYGYGS